jgi:HlyD family secretion protein
VRNAFLFTALLILLAACEQEVERADAYGNFEATETLISAEANGKILFLDIQEGATIQAGQVVGLIDTTALHLQRQQLLARIGAVNKKTRTAEPEVEVLKMQKQNLLREEERVRKLLRDSAATPKQLDDLSGQIKVVDRQIRAIESQAATANRGVLAEVSPIEAQIRVIEDQIRRCAIINPIEGIVLTQLAEPHEITAMGRPLYTIAPMKTLSLRAYVSGAQLPHLKIGQAVEVLIDENESSNKKLEGTVSWISSTAEFTPKTIQTKEERVNLVYAVKVSVPNDGSLKIGMPGEINFMPEVEEGDKNE